MKLEYIKTKNGKTFYPQKAGVKDESKVIGNYPVCIIEKSFLGTFIIEYFDVFNCTGFHTIGDNREDIPNTRIILYPNGIEEMCYIQSSE